MKRVDLARANLNTCVEDAQQERVILTRKGKPVALVVGLEGMDQEQLRLGSSNKFWRLITERRAQKTLTRAQLAKSLGRRRAD